MVWRGAVRPGFGFYLCRPGAGSAITGTPVRGRPERRLPWARTGRECGPGAFRFRARAAPCPTRMRREGHTPAPPPPAADAAGITAGGPSDGNWGAPVGRWTVQPSHLRAAPDRGTAHRPRRPGPPAPGGPAPTAATPQRITREFPVPLMRPLGAARRHPDREEREFDESHAAAGSPHRAARFGVPVRPYRPSRARFGRLPFRNSLARHLSIRQFGSHSLHLQGVSLSPDTEIEPRRAAPSSRPGRTWPKEAPFTRFSEIEPCSAQEPTPSRHRPRTLRGPEADRRCRQDERSRHLPLAHARLRRRDGRPRPFARRPCRRGPVEHGTTAQPRLGDRPPATSQ